MSGSPFGPGGSGIPEALVRLSRAYATTAATTREAITENDIAEGEKSEADAL